jgi:hypothetical protein
MTAVAIPNAIERLRARRNVIGSLLASHTPLGLTTHDRLGLKGMESATVTVGATVMSETLSLIVFATCVSTYTTGFSTYW